MATHTRVESTWCQIPKMLSCATVAAENFAFSTSAHYFHVPRKLENTWAYEIAVCSIMSVTVVR